MQQSPVHQVQDLASGGVSADDPAWSRLGRWDPVLNLSNVAIHTHVLPNGKVLFWGRRDRPNGSLNEHECTPQLWDPRTGEINSTPQPQLADGTKVNLFCSGHAFLPDGRLLVAGGHITDSNGLNQACVYDFQTNSWTALPLMNQGRWYPTATALADGRILVLSGSFIKDGMTMINDLPQIWDGQRWESAEHFVGLPLYPRVHVGPDGQVFMSGTNAQTYLLNTGETGTWTPLPPPGGIRRNGVREYAPSVMYDVGKVIYIGGGNSGPTDAPTAAAEVIDLGANPPAWREVAGMHFARRQHNATILADGTVLVTGGTRGPGFNDLSPGSPVHAAELWNPATEEWTQLAAEDIDRCYHSTAVLLPDATVLSAGSGEFAVGSGANDSRDSHRNAQVFRPPYLFHGPRPEITSAPEKVDYGQVFSLEVSGPALGRITWIKLPSVTHAFDQNQRINFLGFSVDHGKATVSAPEQPEICPPGHYMLFAISQAGVPSLARIIQIGSLPSQHPEAGPPMMAEEGAQVISTGKTRTETLDEAIRSHATGTHVTIGLTTKCPYGLGACWAGAYEALKGLNRVAAVRPIANPKDSTAEVYLRDKGLPDLHNWINQFAGRANRSYDIRGVEVTLVGSIRAQNGILQLTGDSLERPVTLMPLQQDLKVQWDHQDRRVQDATSDELNAYMQLETRYHNRAGGMDSVRVTGPLTMTEAKEYVLYVRHFAR